MSNDLYLICCFYVLKYVENVQKNLRLCFRHIQVVQTH